MEFGYFTLTDNHYPDNPRSANQFITEIRDQAILADKLGMHSAWIGEHHFDSLGVNSRPDLTHVVLNSADTDRAERFAIEVLGFRLSDRTRHMTFVRCNRAHHCIAYARAGMPSLNHIAFEMQDIDAVMRGIGRLRDAGYACVWGPGRHGPGNNVFGYFIGPHGGILEYTAEVEEVGDDYRVGGPDDWKWPPGRIDQWGVSSKDTAHTDLAERAFRWASEKCTATQE